MSQLQDALQIFTVIDPDCVLFGLLIPLFTTTYVHTGTHTHTTESMHVHSCSFTTRAVCFDAYVMPSYLTQNHHSVLDLL